MFRVRFKHRDEFKSNQIVISKNFIKAIEINKKACIELSKLIGNSNVFNKSIFDFESEEKFDLTLQRGY